MWVVTWRQGYLFLELEINSQAHFNKKNKDHAWNMNFWPECIPAFYMGHFQHHPPQWHETKHEISCDMSDFKTVCLDRKKHHVYSHYIKIRSPKPLKLTVFSSLDKFLIAYASKLPSLFIVTMRYTSDLPLQALIIHLKNFPCWLHWLRQSSA